MVEENPNSEQNKKQQARSALSSRRDTNSDFGTPRFRGPDSFPSRVSELARRGARRAPSPNPVGFHTRQRADDLLSLQPHDPKIAPLRSPFPKRVFNLRSPQPNSCDELRLVARGLLLRLRRTVPLQPFHSLHSPPPKGRCKYSPIRLCLQLLPR